MVTRHAGKQNIIVIFSSAPSQTLI